MKFDKIRRKFGMYEKTNGSVRSLEVITSEPPLVQCFRDFVGKLPGDQVLSKELIYKHMMGDLLEFEFSEEDIQQFIRLYDTKHNAWLGGVYISAAVNKIAEPEEIIRLDVRNKNINSLGYNLRRGTLVLKGTLTEDKANVLGENMTGGKLFYTDESALDEDGYTKNDLSLRLKSAFKMKKKKVSVGAIAGYVDIHGCGIKMTDRETRGTQQPYIVINGKKTKHPNDRRIRITKKDLIIPVVLASTISYVVSFQHMQNERRDFGREIKRKIQRF